MLKRIVKKLVKLSFSTVFHFLPRNKHLWLTGKVSSWEYENEPPQFFDNSKYFYLYLHHKTDEKVYWISSSKTEIDLLKSLDLPVVKYKSLKSFYLILRAKFFYHHYGTDQIMPEFQRGAVQIDFWHGTPLKKVRYDVVPKVEFRKNCVQKMLDRGSIEYVASTSSFLSEEILSQAFQVPMECLMNYGYPRMDVMGLNEEKTIYFCEKYSKDIIPYINIAQNYSKVFLYMPTWRDDNPNYFLDANIDFERMNHELKKIGGVLFLKLHPITTMVKIDNYDNIIQMSNDVDIYPFLRFTDYLITDYSSIYFDYLPLDKEIIFIPYDKENYLEHREMYFEYDDVTPGKKFYSFDEFIDNIENIDQIDFSAQRRAIKERFIENYNFDACEKTYLYLKDKYK